MILNAHGKINLSLDITGRREDGYHYVSMVMQSVALCDVVSVDKNSSGAVFVKSDNPEVPDGQENLAYKACELMISQFCLNCGFDVFIQKHIPVAGGMAGGSTDAAAVMKAVNHLCGLQLSQRQLMELGLCLGADVPFCIQEKPALATGIGEILTSVAGLPENVWILLVNPNEKISTKTIYEMVDQNLVYSTVDNRALISALEMGNLHLASHYMKNVMQAVSTSLCGKITKVLQQLKELGAVCALMSGSGATCFGIFETMPDLKAAESKFSGCYVSLTKPLSFHI